jgi:hypothetical protein
VIRLEQYDVLVVGSDIASLIGALFLARKLRSVAVILDPQEDDTSTDIMDITDPENNKYHFVYDRTAYLGGLSPTGLVGRYFQTIGLDKEIKAQAVLEDVLFTGEGDSRTRPNQFDQLRIYLVRYYPKERDAIHRFFRDLDRHYLNYVMQQESMLKNRDYTLTSLMIEWGDYPLKELLGKYFTDPAIITEFMTNPTLNGLDPENVNSYHFFSHFFLGLKEGFFQLVTTPDEIREMLLEKLRIINPSIIQKRRIKEYVYDDSGKIVHVIDTTNRKIAAKHFVARANPLQFFKDYFPSFADEIGQIQKYYPDLDTSKRINTLFLALNQPPESLGVQEPRYYFPTDNASEPVILRLFHYDLFDKENASKKIGRLCLDYTDSALHPASQEALLTQLYRYFPKLKKTIVGIRQGKSRPYVAMVSDESVRKGLSINEQIAIEAGEHLMFFDNLHLVGNWLRPEAGLFGKIHSGIILGDKIEENLYYGEDDDSFYYLTNDEIMMMLRHNYRKKTLGKKEIHINFHIGKSDYFVRTKGKNITIHRGEYAVPDLTLYSTNDKFSNLLLKKVGFNEVLEGNGLKYTGSTDLLYDVVSVFNLDDYQEPEARFHPKLKMKFPGVKVLFLELFVFSVAAFLSNFVSLIWLMPFCLFVSLAMVVVRSRVFRVVSWFEIAWAGIYLTLLMVAIFVPQFRSWRNDDLLLGLMGGMFFICWLINRPIVYDYHRYDFLQEYTDSALFKVINNGLTFVWSLVFLMILAGPYIGGEKYMSVWYNLVFLGFFMTYYYPVIYIRTNIKK